MNWRRVLYTLREWSEEQLDQDVVVLLQDSGQVAEAFSLDQIGPEDESIEYYDGEKAKLGLPVIRVSEEY